MAGWWKEVPAATHPPLTSSSLKMFRSLRAEGPRFLSPEHSELCERRPGSMGVQPGSEPLACGGRGAARAVSASPAGAALAMSGHRRFWIAADLAMPWVRAFLMRCHTQGVARKLAVPWAEETRAFSPKDRHASFTWRPSSRGAPWLACCLDAATMVMLPCPASKAAHRPI